MTPPSDLWQFLLLGAFIPILVLAACATVGIVVGVTASYAVRTYRYWMKP